MTFRGIMDKIKWIITGKIGPIVDKWGQLHELYIHRKVCGQHVIHRVKLVYYEEHETKNEAMSREYAIKHLTRKEKEILIKGNGNLCGSWMVKGDMIKAGEFEKIKKLTREAKELAE